ncbi:cellulose biosynthesis protein [Sulfurifustis variabilis]|uniref:Cellulose biosynthesis protein n=1 Tax=Sulfurifustis variabilis TaxID=1675686 RepID=A0A1B4VBF1_9GAMM|nr:GNAT family N-acetyltransferase [Sulfurifustis variabilis]BAU47911.1 cellulose biosynthesis protein [Sulfurifustis variabilis]
MQVACIDTDDGFRALREEWDALVQAAAAASIFTTWEWQYLWWRHYGGGQKLRLLVARAGGRLVGVFPLYVQRVTPLAGVGAGLLRLIGTGGDTSPDYLEPPLAPGHEADAARVLVDAALAIEGWDVLAWSDLEPDGAIDRAAMAALRERGLPARRGTSARISYVPLPASWDAYLESQSRDRRYTIRNTRRKFEREPGARFLVWDGASLDDAFDRLTALHHKRWQTRGTSHSFDSSTYNDFHRAVMRACRERDWLRLYSLEREGEIIAMYYCYRFRGTVYYFQGGFDPQYEKLRPGLCLMGYALEHAIGEGQRVFDMLRGEYDYKKQWARETRETCFTIAYRRTAPAFVYWLRRSLLPEAKRLAQRMVSTAPARNDG